MLDFLIDNSATIITLFVVLAIIGLAVFKIVKDKKQGKTSCGCGCEGCALSDKCKGRK
jgi:hypothetical protein